MAIFSKLTLVSVRGTACGIASALSRMYVSALSCGLLPFTQKFQNRGGMIAPIVGGSLLIMGRSVPVYTSVVIFAIAGICVLSLKENEGDGSRGNAEIAVH
jgi:hypothetical protein